MPAHKAVDCFQSPVFETACSGEFKVGIIIVDFHSFDIS